MTSLPTVLFPLAVGLALGGLFAWLWGRGEVARLAERLRAHEAEATRRGDLAAEHERLHREAERLRALAEADARRIAWLEDAEARLRTAFEAVAGDVVRDSGAAVVAAARRELETVLSAAGAARTGDHAAMGRLLQPVAESLGRLDEEVRQLERRREGAYQGLRQELGLLRDAQGQLLATTVDLKRALRASGVRGRWGELQLRRVVEMAGMLEHVDFDEQPALGLQRPDMIVHLPNGGRLPVDAKAPMDAYLAAAEAADEPARRSALDGHRRALRQRVAELGQRRYAEAAGDGPGFVVLFLPGEAALAAAFEEDPEILDHALGHRVLPASPITLLALLKTVAFGWRQHRVADDARRLAELGRDLHHRLATFTDHLAKLGRSLDGAVGSYNLALGSLERRVLPAARRLEDSTGGEAIAAPAAVAVRPRLPAVEDGEEATAIAASPIAGGLTPPPGGG